MQIELRDTDGILIIAIDPTVKYNQVLVNGDLDGQSEWSVYTEHLEKFALELTRALGHDFNPKVL